MIQAERVRLLDISQLRTHHLYLSKSNTDSQDFDSVRILVCFFITNMITAE